MSRESVGILFLPDRRWGEHRKTAANLAPRLARSFPLVWVTPAHHWRDIGARRRSGRPVFRRPEDGGGLTVYEPPAHLPMTYRPGIAARFLRSRRLARARAELVRLGARRIVLYVWRPKYADALDLVEHDVSIYHVVDEYSFSSDDPPTPPDERRLIGEADRLIVHSPALIDKKGRPDTDFVPNGVDYASFAEPCAEPADLAEIGRPRIGYCGYVKHQMDWELLETLVRRHADWHWVIVGKLRHRELAGRVEALGRRPNVHFLGEKSTEELARYPQHFDVCVMPYVRDGYTKYIYPLKLHEYLAAGRPTVGTPIRTLRDFDHVVELAEGADEWSAALERCLAPGARGPEAKARRQQVAREHDWDVLAERVASLIDEEVARSDDARTRDRTTA
ncbi:MAG: glycosyltransferase [Gemmatimonadota bacterium]